MKGITAAREQAQTPERSASCLRGKSVINLGRPGSLGALYVSAPPPVFLNQSLLEEDLSGNVKKLKGSRNEYRLRVGDYRVLFELEGRTATVYTVGNRKDIYR